MGYIMGQCPQCNNVMSMPDDSAIVRCPTCQAEVSAAEASALAGGNPEIGGTQPTTDPYSAAQQFSSNPDTWIQQPPVFATNAPLLGTWKTNVIFTILGVLAAAIFNGFVGGSLDENGQATGGAITGIFSLAYLIFCIVYAAKIYPSYFTEKPMITSNEAISFLNTFVGGIIFGLLWNHNLTRQDKGISNIVFIVLIGVSFVLAILLVFLVIGAVATGAIA